MATASVFLAASWPITCSESWRTSSLGLSRAGIGVSSRRNAPMLAGSALFGKNDIDFEDLVVALLFQGNADVLGVHLDVLGDHGDQLALQVGQEIDAAAAAIALMGDDQLQAFLGDLGGLRLVAKQFLEPGHVTCLRTGASRCPA